jgi:AmiR/NasT family two-component response regulator
MGYLSVLLADDEVLTRMDIREYLTQEGHIVCAETGNGLEAIELAKITSPNIALLDIKMPGLDGIEVAVQLKAMGIPTVLMTGYNQQGFVSRAEKVGVYGYLNKPIREQDIIPTMIIAYSRWNEMQKLSQEIDAYKRKLENQKSVEIAKGIFAKQNGISEYEAHKAILKISMNQSRPMISVCDEIIKKNIANKK